jgi:hypothetical protein
MARVSLIHYTRDDPAQPALQLDESVSYWRRGAYALAIALCCTAAFGQVSHTIASTTAPIPSPASLSAQPSTNPAAITLPLEVIGPDGTTVSASFVAPAEANLSGPLRLSMTIHGLRFDAQASVQVNNSGWLPISTANVTLLGNAAAYGGIGGGFHTLKMTMSLPAGAVTAGSNNITFRFNGTEGRVSGFRVLAFNLHTAAGNALIPSSTFVYDDPNTWKPPSTRASDIKAGKTLWSQAALTVPVREGSHSIHAHCSDCHAQDGRDLKYFNYSNNSIRARSMFHGLSAAQGDQIASYVRSLNVPNPGRPWNPPYQPGPGLDSRPVDQWAAGAGLDAVLASDQDLVNELFPGGAQAGAISPASVLNVRETAIPLQMLDWNSWLPFVHPLDSWPDFAASGLNARYSQLRNELRPGDAATYAAAKQNFMAWGGDYLSFIIPKTNRLPRSTWTPAYVGQVYSTPLWLMVKNWELNQEFRLDGMPHALYTNPKAESRAWFSEFPFLSSPNMLHIPPGAAGLDNGNIKTWTYLAMAWYHTQLILDNSEYEQNGSSPIDWGYVYGIVKDLSQIDSPPQAGMFNLWMIKGMQISNNGIGPEHRDTGWDWLVADPSRLVSPAERNVWTGMRSSTRAAISNQFVEGWLTEVHQFTPQQFWTGGFEAARLPVRSQPDSSNFEDRVWYMIPRFRYLGVHQAMINELATWAKSIWPQGNWDATTTARCMDDPGDPALVHCSTD